MICDAKVQSLLTAVLIAGRYMMVNRFDTEFVRHVSEVFSCLELRVESFLFYNQTVRW